MVIIAKLSLSPSEAGLSKLYNQGETTTRQPPQPLPTATATTRASENKLLNF